MEIHFQEVQKETEGMLGFPDQVRFNAHNTLFSLMVICPSNLVYG